MDPALEKLKQALAEYLAQGGDTPVAPEAQALMDALDQTGGAMGAAGGPPDMSGMDPTAGGDPNDPNAANAYPPAVGGGDAAPSLQDIGAPQGAEMPPPQHGAKTFEGARAGAKKRLKALNGK